MNDLNGIEAHANNCGDELVTSEGISSRKSLQAILFEITELAARIKAPSTFFEHVNKIILNDLNISNFAVSLLEEDNSHYQDIFRHVTMKQVTFMRQDNFGLEQIIEHRTPVFISGSSKPNLSDANCMTLTTMMCTYWMGVPIIDNGKILGIIRISDSVNSGVFTDEHLELLNLTARLALLVITRFEDHKCLNQQLESKTIELQANNLLLEKQYQESIKANELRETLLKISQLSNNTCDKSDPFLSIFEVLKDFIHAQDLFIIQQDEDRTKLELVFKTSSLSTDSEIRFQNKMTRHVLNLNTPLFVDSPELLSEGSDDNEQVQKVVSWLGVPLISNCKTIGAIVVQSYDEESPIRHEDLSFLQHISAYVVSLLRNLETNQLKEKQQQNLELEVLARTRELSEANKELVKQKKALREAALQDSLTNLPNRTLFVNKIDDALLNYKHKKNNYFAVLFIDLDRFKVINDSLGHHFGDELLVEVGTSLKEIVKSRDVVSRIGGDEFAVLLNSINSPEDAYSVAQRIVDRLSEPFVIAGQLVHSGSSVGVSLSNPRYSSSNEMLRDADAAMYRAKEKGKGCYEVFNSDMHQEALNSLKMECSIRSGIKNDEFKPFFQPIVDMKSGRLSGFEALARWVDKDNNMITPDKFIPLAEETKLIAEIDFCIMNRAVKQLKMWQRETGDDNLYVSVNLNCNHFFDSTLPCKIQEVISRNNLNPNSLRLEITETALLEESATVKENLDTLAAMGIKLLLDDFGTGYSSLSYLYKFPLDILKIDKSFVENIDVYRGNRQIIKTIIDLAKSLNMRTVAEGIEQESDYDFLCDVNCEYGQGYFLSKPMDAVAATQYVREEYREYASLTTAM